MPEPLPNTDYIAFADDITQITSGRYKHRDAARNTEHAIRQLMSLKRNGKSKLTEVNSKSSQYQGKTQQTFILMTMKYYNTQTRGKYWG